MQFLNFHFEWHEIWYNGIMIKIINIYVIYVLLICVFQFIPNTFNDICYYKFYYLLLLFTVYDKLYNIIILILNIITYLRMRYKVTTKIARVTRPKQHWKRTLVEQSSNNLRTFCEHFPIKTTQKLFIPWRQPSGSPQQAANGKRASRLVATKIPRNLTKNSTKLKRD